MTTSPSRSSSGTAPISRRYMRTGSVLRAAKSEPSSVAVKSALISIPSSSELSSAASKTASTGSFSESELPEVIDFPSFSVSTRAISCCSIWPMISSNISGALNSGGRALFTSSNVRYPTALPLERRALYCGRSLKLLITLPPPRFHESAQIFALRIRIRGALPKGCRHRIRM